MSLAPAGAESLPRFDTEANLAALAADPPHWPARTSAVSLLALDVTVPRRGLAQAFPPRRLRLEFLDYPGEWLLDLPLLNESFSAWSAGTLRRMEQQAEDIGREFLAFVRGLPARTPADESLAAAGHRLFRAALIRMRDQRGLSFLQPGRFLMPAPGPEPPWMVFFPMNGSGGLATLLHNRFDAYREAVARDLTSPLFGRVDRLVVLADVLSALHAGPEAFADMAEALGAAAAALRWRQSWIDSIPVLRDLLLPDWMTPDWLLPAGIRRVAFAATKADHVADRQRGNLAALMRNLVGLPERGASATTVAFAIASVRCTEDFVWTLEGRNISAVRGRVLGEERMTRSYPGEVPDRPPDPAFWTHAFLALPEFEPRQLPANGRAGVPMIGLDGLLAFLLEDVL